MAFDNGSSNGKRLDDIGVDRPLCQPLDLFQLTGLLLEEIDKSFSDNLPLLFRVGHPCQLPVEAFTGIYTDHVQSQVLIILKYGFELIFAQRSEEHTSELQSRPHLVCRLLLE